METWRTRREVRGQTRSAGRTEMLNVEGRMLNVELGTRSVARAIQHLGIAPLIRLRHLLPAAAGRGRVNLRFGHAKRSESPFRSNETTDLLALSLTAVGEEGAEAD